MTKLDHQSTSEAESYRPLVSPERVKEIKDLRQAMSSQEAATRASRPTRSWAWTCGSPLRS